MTATSVSESAPSVLAENSRPSLNVTLSRVALATTWRLVTMLPRASMTTPEPVPRCGPGSGIPGPNWKKRRNGDVSSSPRPSPCATRGWPTSTSMRTTDGRNAFAVVENAVDSTRASFGASVLGVTGPPGASVGAGGGSCAALGAAVLPGAVCWTSPERDPDPPRRHPGEAAMTTTATTTATLTRRYLARSEHTNHPDTTSSPIPYRR